MSDIQWTPDENGVPMCQPECPYHEEFDPGDGDAVCSCEHQDMKGGGDDLEMFPIVCYPAMVKIVKAAKAFVENWEDVSYESANRQIKSVNCANAIKEALKHDK